MLLIFADKIFVSTKLTNKAFETRMLEHERPRIEI